MRRVRGSGPIQRGVFFVPVGSHLVGVGESEHFGFTVDFADEGHTGGLAFGVDAVADNDARVPCHIRHRGVQVDQGTAANYAG